MNNRLITPQMCITHDHVAEGKVRLQAMLREGKSAVQVEKRYPDGSLLLMRFQDSKLTIERWGDKGELLRRDVELIIPMAHMGSEAKRVA